ncbi:MAG TPA: PilZ domain-containing protein [bacterium]|nr:PilZ domain-containing protein [bacterium]
MKKNIRAQVKNNKRTNRRVVMVKSVKGSILSPLRAGETFKAQLINVSSTGAQIYSNKSVENNTEISLELGSLDGSHIVAFNGKVVWARKNPMKSMGRLAYGVNFENLTSDHLKFLETNYSLSEDPTEE